MKTCPRCAQIIEDTATRCDRCGRDWKAEWVTVLEVVLFVVALAVSYAMCQGAMH